MGSGPQCPMTEVGTLVQCPWAASLSQAAPKPNSAARVHQKPDGAHITRIPVTHHTHLSYLAIFC